MTRSQTVTLTLRATMELGVVVALAYWGYHLGWSTPTRIAFLVGAPLVGFGIWGAVDFRGAGALAEPLRLIEELVISGLAAAGLYVAGRPELGLALAALSLVYHALVYLTGERLLKPLPQ